MYLLAARPVALRRRKLRPSSTESSTAPTEPGRESPVANAKRTTPVPTNAASKDKQKAQGTVDFMGASPIKSRLGKPAPTSKQRGISTVHHQAFWGAL